LAFWPPAGWYRQKLSAAAASGRLRQCEIRDLRIAVQPSAGSFLAAPVEIRIHHTDSAFYPIIGRFERAAGFTHEDTPKEKLNKLGALLSPSPTSVQDAALLAEMLSLPNDGRYPILDLTSQQWGGDLGLCGTVVLIS
jgi:hypothetical protein